MNCKPGDLAIVVIPEATGSTWALGRIVRCLSVTLSDGWACWFVHPIRRPDGVMCIGFADFCLRPLPGIDVVDVERHCGEAIWSTKEPA